MNHERCRERLVELVYGELAGREAREVERHLEACDACRAERDGLAATRAAMRQLEAPCFPERVDPIVVAAARRAAERKVDEGFAAALRGFGAKVAAGTAVAVLLALVLLNVGRVREKGPIEMMRAHQASPPRAERRAEAPPQATEVEPPPVPAAEPQVEPAPEPMAKRGAEQRSAAPRSRAKEEAVRAAPRAPLVAAPRMGGRTAADGVASGGAARPAPKGDEERRLEERDQPGRGQARRQEEPPGRDERVTEGAQAFAVAPQAAPGPAHGPQAPLAAAPTSTRGRPAAAAPAPAEADSAGEAQRTQRFGAAKAASAPVARGVSPRTEVARDIERRRAAGELSEAVRRFEPCPGGDRRRTAWIDRAQHILKLSRERSDGTWIEEWFDTSGRLREALVHSRAGGAPWTRRIVIEEGGARTSEDEGANGLAPEMPPPPLDERDPSDAFFAGPGCGR